MSRRSLKVFLCHSSGDKPATRSLYFQLRSAAVYIVPWLDKENLLPGQRWEYEISLAVRGSDIVLVCVSNNSIRKTGYVQKEIKDALDVADRQPEGTIFLIPVKLEECQIPDRLSHLHYVNLFEKGGFDTLMRSLALRARELGINVARENVARQIQERIYSAEERREIITHVIAQELGVEESALTPDADVESLGGDWLDAIEIRNELEDRFGIEISEDDAKHSRIVADIFTTKCQAGA